MSLFRSGSITADSLDRISDFHSVGIGSVIVDVAVVVTFPSSPLEDFNGANDDDDGVGFLELKFLLMMATLPKLFTNDGLTL